MLLHLIPPFTFHLFNRLVVMSNKYPFFIRGMWQTIGPRAILCQRSSIQLQGEEGESARSVNSQARRRTRPMRRVAVLQRVPGVFRDPSFQSGFFLTFPSHSQGRRHSWMPQTPPPFPLLRSFKAERSNAGQQTGGHQAALLPLALSITPYSKAATGSNMAANTTTLGVGC